MRCCAAGRVERPQRKFPMLAASGEKAASGGEAVGLEVERAIGRRLFERGKVGLFDLKTANEDDFVLDTGGLEEVAELEVVDVDTSWDDIGFRLDVLHRTRHCGVLYEDARGKSRASERGGGWEEDTAGGSR